MATSLAQQLQRLAAPQSALVIHKKSRPSVLFDKREAALLDRDTVFAIGLDGFDDLLKLNPALVKYQNTLFSESAKTMERAVQTREVNDQLDQLIEEFLTHVSPLLLLKPTQKALEWLVYRFHINEFNPNAILRCILPYHDTNIFVRMLQLLQLKEPTNRWHWLYPLQNPGVPLAKTTLAKHCAEDLSFMKFLCIMNKKIIKVHGTESTSLHAPLAFFVSAICAALERCAAISEPQLALLVPHLLRCLASPLPELRAGGCMLVGQLARRASLSAELSERLFTALVNSAAEALTAECVASLAVLAQTQELVSAPVNALKPLHQAQDRIIAALHALAQRCSVLPLVACLLSTCLLESVRGKARRAGAITTALVTDVRLTVAREQEALISSVARLFLGPSEEVPPAELLTVVCPVLTTLERQYPAPFDAVMASVAAAADQKGDGRARSLLAALRGHVGGAAGSGVFVDLNHPEEETRYYAIKTLMKSLREGEFSDEGLVWSALTTALDDPSDRVAKLALRVPVQMMLAVSDLPELERLVTGCLDAGHRPAVELLCAGVLAQLHSSTSEAGAGTRPLSAALLTSLLPALSSWSERTAARLRDVAEQLQLTDLCTLLSRESLCSHSEYSQAALQQLSALVCSLSAEARRCSLVALSARAAASALPPARRTAAAALAASCLRRQPTAAAETLQPLLAVLEDAQLKVPAPPPLLAPQQLLQDGAAPPAALLCLLTAAIDAAQPVDAGDAGWLSEEQVGHLGELYQAAALGLSHPRSRLRPLCQAVVAHLFKARVPTLPAQLAFLCRFWTVPSAATALATLAAAVAALVMASALLRAAPAARLPPLLAPGAPLLPSLLVALQSPLSQVRKAALECLQTVAGVKVTKGKAPLLPLAVQMLSYRDEVSSDPEAVGRCLSAADGDWRHQVTALVVADQVPDQVRTALASLLAPLADQASARACLPVLSSLLAEVAAGGALSAPRSALVVHLLRLMAPETAACLSEPAGWAVLSAALSCQKQGLSRPGGALSPQGVAIGQVTRALFSALSEETQQKLVTLLVDLCTDSTGADATARLQKVLRKLPLSAGALVQQLGEGEAPAKKTVRQPRTTRRSAAATSTAPAEEQEPPPAAGETVDSRAWRRRTVVLETLQARRRLQQPAALVAPLFSLLRRLLQLPATADVEYPRQLALTCLQQACERLQQAEVAPPAELRAGFSVETLVQCVRSSESPQTHQLTLIVLSMAATMLPEMVLHNIMAIFTFMGLSMLRQDNEYSFRVIERTVESIIPALLKASSLVSPGREAAVPVLRVFCDALRDVPRHRRPPLFAHLLRTLGERRYLWLCMLMLSDQLATRGDLRDKMADDTVTVAGDRSAPLLLEFAVSLCGEFGLDVQLASCSRLLEHTEALVHLRHADDSPSGKYRPDAGTNSVDASDTALFDLGAHTDKQFYKHCHTAVGMVAEVLASEPFVTQSASLSPEAAAAAQQQHQLLLERAVRLITACARLCQGPLRQREDDLRHLRAILHRLYALLDKINSLLPSAMFLSVVTGLLGSELGVVRRRAMELLATRLQLQTAFFSEADTEPLLAVTAELLTVAQSGGSGGSEEADHDSALNRQTALFALKLLSRLLAGKHPKTFVPVLRAVCEQAADPALSPPLFASCLLCMAELCASLRAHAIAWLPSITAVLLPTLGDDQRLSNELVLVSAVTLTQKLVEALPHFVSAYLAELLTHVCRLSALHAHRGAASALQHRLKQARHQLATAVPVRVLLPAVSACFSRLAVDGSAGARQLMALLSECVSETELVQLNAELPTLQNLLMPALDYRGAAPAAADGALVADVEADVIGAVTSLVPRLSETTFRPFFLRLYEWATGADAPASRTVTFYRLTDSLADRLKGLFVLFAGHFVRHLASVLENNSSISEKPQFPDDDCSAAEVVLYALDCLSKVCCHDTEGFLTKDRFNALMQPLVDQLENRQGTGAECHSRLSQHLVPCLVSFFVAAGDDSLWKPANYQILLKMRHQNAEVRLAAVAALAALHARLGDDYMTLLPETMPFLAELLEDEEPRVETACQRLIQDMENTLGESLQKYF